MATVGHPCIDQSVFYSLPKEDQEAFVNRMADLQKLGFDPKESSVRAAREMQEKVLDNLSKVHKQLGVDNIPLPKPKVEPVEVKEPQTAYKPNIRDDYFAKADFFSDKEKETYSHLDDESKDKMIDEKRAELKAEYEGRVPLKEVVDKPVLYNGKRAIIYKDGQTLVAKIEGENREYELGNADEIGNDSIRDYGIEQQSSVVGADEEGDVTVRGQKYVNHYSDPLAAINRDADGNVVSVNLETVDGKKRTFRGDIAEDVAYQIHLKEINKNNATKTDFENFINEEPEIRQEVENGGLQETPPEKPVENNGKVSREPAKVKEKKPSISVIMPKPREVEAEPVKKKDKPEYITDSEGQQYSNTPRIRKLIQKANEILEKLPKVAEGYTRLYRANRPGELGENPSFTNALVGIALPFQESYKGPLSYVDVPTKDLNKYEQSVGSAKGNEFTLPSELSKSAKEIPSLSTEPLTPEQQHIADLEASAARLEAEGDTSPELQAMKDRITELKTPPPPPEPPAKPPRKTAESPKEEWTAVRKEKQEEIAGAKELFDRQKEYKWSDIFDSALHNVQAMYPDKPLYEAMKSRVDYFMTKLENKELYNPTSEDIAMFKVYKNQTVNKIAQINGFGSPDEIMRQNAAKEFADFNQELYKIVQVNNPEGEAGRAFGLLQAEIASDEEHGLKIRRMDLQGSKGGGKLSEQDLQYTAAKWEEERKLIARENELKQKAIVEKFEKAIAKLKEEKAPATAKEKREKLLKQSGKDFADKLREGKIKGTYATFPGVPQAINLVIEGIAQLVEGGATLAQAISDYVKANKIQDEEKFKDNFFGVLGKHEKMAEAYQSIEKLADAGAKGITDEMVAKNMIRDYVNSHAGLHDTKEILDQAHTELKKILPDLEKNQLIEAYLKTGDFKQPTKAKLETGFRESERNLNKLASLEKDINDLNEKNDLFKKSSNKTSPYDKDVAAKEKERNDIMTKMGVKTSGEDKYTKASYDDRAKAHNDRLDNIGKMIDQKLSDPSLSKNAVKELSNLKAKIDASKIKLDPNSALSQDKVLQAGADLLKSIKSDFSRSTQGDILKTGDVNRELQRSIDKFNTDKEDFTQNVKLQRAKDKALREKDEFKRKIAAEEYEDEPIIDLTKADAELLKIKRDRDLIADDFYNKKHEYQKANQPWWQKVGNLGRSLWVASLIGKPFTLAKVGASALLRPFLETVTRMTTSKVFEALPFSTTKAITERARAGGESSSIRAAQKGYEAYLRQYSPKQLEDRYKAASDKYEKAESEYFKMKDDPNADRGKLQELKDKKDDALIDAIGQSVFQYIGGASVKEAMEVLIHRSTELERELGHFDREAWKKGTGGLRDVDNIEYLMNFIGRSHAMLKNFSARYSFASGFMARVEAAVKSGEFVANPDKVLEMAHESYIDWDRGKYQEPNWVSDTWNKVTNAVDKVSPQFAYLLKFDVAITRVPVNMLREGIMEYTLGAFRGSVMAAREYYKAKGIVLQDGYTPESDAQFKKELNEQLQQIDPGTAATIIRSFRKGGFGLGLYALAIFGSASFGGWAHRGQSAENKAKKKREEQTGIPEIKVGEIKIGNWVMPEWAAKVSEHTPAFAPLGYGLGLAQVYQNNIEDGKTTPEAAANAAMAQVNHILGSIPQIDKVVMPISKGIGDIIVPSGQWEDVDQQGNPMKREAFHMSDYLNYLPGTDKKNVLSEHYYKQAVAAQKSARQLITLAEINTSLSPKEKSDLREQYLKQLKERVDEIYRLNKEKPQ